MQYIKRGRQYTFDGFEVTKFNSKAFDAAKKFAENADSKPLALFGSTATGKTHLLYAVQNRILQNNPNAKLYLTNAREMTKDLLLAITEDRDFYSFYSDADVLLIDDLQDVVDKEETMNEFLYLINKLTRSTKIMPLLCSHITEQKKSSLFFSFMAKKSGNCIPISIILHLWECWHQMRDWAKRHLLIILRCMRKSIITEMC